MAVTSYITSTDLAKEMSQSGVDLRSDDDVSVVAQAIADASIEADGYVLLQYSRAYLVKSDWYALKVKHIAAFMLATRRENPCPQGIQVKYEKAIADLEKVQAGKKFIPDIAQRRQCVPVVSTPRVTLRPHPRIVIAPSRSTGQAIGYPQRVDETDYGEG